MKLKHIVAILIIYAIQPLYSAAIPQGENAEPPFNGGVEYHNIDNINTNQRAISFRSLDNGLKDQLSEKGIAVSGSDNFSQITIQLNSAQTLAGKIDLTLDRNLSISPDNPLPAYIFVKGKTGYKLVSTETFNLDGSLSSIFGGQYTDEITVLVPQMESDAPSQIIASANVGEIINDDAVKIMLLGDSITWGEYDNAEEGLRKRLYERLTNAGYNFDFVGSWGEAPYEGHFRFSQKIDDFYPPDLLGGDHGNMDVTNPMNNHRPNIVAFHLGTNDLNSQYKDVGPYEENGEIINTQSGEVAVLIDYLLKWHNGEFGENLDYIIVSLIIPMEDTARSGTLEKCIEFNKEVARLARDYRNGVLTGQPEPVYICDHFSRLQENPYIWTNEYFDPMYDMMHPTKEGLDTMGDTYFDVFNYILSGETKWFRDITWYADVAGFADKYHSYKGVSLVDINQDGYDDIYVTRTAKGDADPRDAFYLSNPQLPYTESAFDYHIEDEEKSNSSVFVDIDNDGDFDMFNGSTTDSPNHLYLNQDNQDFEDISTLAGILNQIKTTTSTLAFDAENDGDMDILAINSEALNEYYVNDGNGSFTSTASNLRDVVEAGKYSISASAADFDNDGDVDIFLSKRETNNKLWLNDGAGNFSDVAEFAGVEGNYVSLNHNGASWADLDNDADLDLILGVSHTSSTPDPYLQVYENQGDGTFDNISNSLAIPMDGLAPIIGDFNNDGWEDILITSVADYSGLYLNQGNWTFAKENNSGTEVYAGDMRGGAPFDYDLDGDLDLIITRADVFNVMMQNNLSNGYNWLRVNAYGPDGNIGGYGTKIWVYESGHVDDADYLLSYREITSGAGYFSQYSPTQHIGMELHSQCDLLARFTDGTMVVMRNVAANQTITIRPEIPQNTGTDPALLAEYSGNNQEKIVGQTLDNPIVVKVTDDEGRPVEGSSVAFQVIEGDATLFIPDLTTDAISVETETGNLSGNMQWFYDLTASGNGFVAVPSYLGGSGSAELQVETAEADQFSVWVRFANAQASDQVTVAIDDYQAKTLTLSSQEGWQWVQIQENSVAYLYNLEQGSHSITLDINSGRPHIDKLLFTTDVNYVPTGAEEGENESPNLTDREGLARRFVELGQTAGEIIVEASLSYNGSPVDGSPVQFSLSALPGTPVTIEKTSGDAQAGDINVPLDEPFVVTIKDAFGNPIPDFQVVFLVLSGGGVIDNNAVNTDELGQASATLTPGSASGLQQVQAIAEGVPGSPVTFTAAIRGVASDMEYVSGNNQTGKVLEFLADPIQVKVLEENGGPAIGYQVNFAVLSDTGGVVDSTTYAAIQQGATVQADSSTQILTNVNGIAKGYWLLGKTAGTTSMQVNAGEINGSPITVNATATAGNPAVILQISGNGQTAAVNHSLPEPLVVRINDKYGNPISGHSVVFTAENGGGFDGSTQIVAQTSNLGDAKAEFSTGETAGTDIYEINASASYNGSEIPGSPVTFLASATSGSAANAYKISGDAQTDTVGHVLKQPFRVRVTDSYNNPVEGFEVRFWVENGNGSFNGQDIDTQVTNANGYASIDFTLDEKAGQNQVQAVFAGLSPEVIAFSATGVHDVPQKLLYVSGDDQSGVRGTRLNQPFQIRITDVFENPVQDHPVSYEVTSELGEIDGLSSFNTSTDELGLARAYLTLGEDLGDSNHVVTVSSEYIGQELDGSPYTFYASVKRGNPARIIPITSTSGLIGAPGQVLPDTIFVKVVDTDNLSIPNFTIKYSILTGNGRFEANDKDTLSVQTDSRGIAYAVWRLGDYQDAQQISVSAIYESEHLENSPLSFSAYAVSSGAEDLVYEAGNNQTGMVGQALPTPLAVKIKDGLGFPVSNHPVTFTVKGGSGTVGTRSDTLVHTNENGIASVIFTLGSEMGDNLHTVEARSSNKGTALTGSPYLFTASGEAGITDAALSTMSAESPIPASGDAFSSVLVKLKDIYGNALANRTVTLSQQGVNTTITPSTGTTNESGTFGALVSSVTPGTVTLTAAADGVELDQTVNISFFSTDASKLTRISDSDIIAFPGSFLAEPLTVKVTDSSNQPVANYPITFQSENTDIAFEYSQPVYTDEDGLASCNVQVCPEPCELTVQAVAGGLTGSPMSFSIYVMMPENLSVYKISGDNQTGPLGQSLSEPVVVQIKDGDNRPAGNMGILFSSENTDVAQVDSGTVKTAADGNAQTTISLGTKSGQTQITARMVGTSKQVTFTVSATSDQAQNLALASENPQSVNVTESLASPLSVKITDDAGNGVADRDVVFKLISGPGELEGDTTQTSNASGLASIGFTASTTSGTSLVRAVSASVPGDTVWFTIKCLPDDATSMEIAAGNNQTGIAGHRLNNKLSVLVSDQYGNGVPQVMITFRAAQGSIEPDSIAVSDSTGHAKASWVLGASATTQSVTAIKNGLDNSPLQFQAQVLSNSAPTIAISTTDLTVAENDSMKFTVQITDAENDSFTVNVQGLPDGAEFNANGVYKFAWLPTYSQAGTYDIKFTATDTLGATSQKFIQLTVTNANRKPVIDLNSSLPVAHVLGTITKGQSIDFYVKATDADNDPLNYIWLVNNEAKATTAEYKLQTQNLDIGSLTVTALVFDQQDTVKTAWIASITTAIELKDFAGVFKNFDGVELNWSTRRETDNSGFYVQRATQKAGPFETVSSLIPSNEKGTYTFTDQEVQAGKTYYYRLEDLQTDGSRTTHEMITVEPPLPKSFTLHQNYPNPFNPSTTIRFETPKPSKITLVVYDILGRTVKTLINDRIEPGYHISKWNGTNAQDLIVAAGVYYMVLNTEEGRFVKKLALVK